MKRILPLIALLILFVTACNKDKNEPDPVPATAPTFVPSPLYDSVDYFIKSICGEYILEKGYKRQIHSNEYANPADVPYINSNPRYNLDSTTTYNFNSTDIANVLWDTVSFLNIPYSYSHAPFSFKLNHEQLSDTIFITQTAFNEVSIKSNKIERDLNYAYNYIYLPSQLISIKIDSNDFSNKYSNSQSDFINLFSWVGQYDPISSYYEFNGHDVNLPDSNYTNLVRNFEYIILPYLDAGSANSGHTNSAIKISKSTNKLFLRSGYSYGDFDTDKIIYNHNEQNGLIYMKN